MQTSVAFNAIKKLKLNNISPTLIHMPTIKPIDKNLLIRESKKHNAIITFEDHNIFGGLGSAVCEVLSEYEPTKVIRMGIRDKIGKSGEAKDLLKEYKIDEMGLINQIKKIMINDIR